MNNQPILDQIETGMDNGIIVLIIAIAAISILVYIINKLLDKLVDIKLQKRLSRKARKLSYTELKPITSSSVRNNFIYNCIDEDIDNMYTTGTPTSTVLSKELINLYNN